MASAVQRAFARLARGVALVVVMAVPVLGSVYASLYVPAPPIWIVMGFGLLAAMWVAYRFLLGSMAWAAVTPCP